YVRRHATRVDGCVLCLAGRGGRGKLLPYTTLFRSTEGSTTSHVAWRKGMWRAAAILGSTGMSRALLSSPVKGMARRRPICQPLRSEEHTSELQSRENLVCRRLLDKKSRRRERTASK